MVKIADMIKRNLDYSHSPNKTRVLYLSNMALIPFEEVLIYNLGYLGVNCEVKTSLYHSPVIEIAKKASNYDVVVINHDPFTFLLDSNQQLVQISLMELENLEQNFIQLVNQILMLLPAGKKIVFIGLSMPNISDLCEHSHRIEKLIEVCNSFLESKTNENVGVFNLQVFTKSIERENIYKTDPLLISPPIYTLNYVRYLAECIAALLASLILPYKKLLVLDCDNTLWGGVVADLGFESLYLGYGTPIGEIFLELQTIFKDFNEKGVLLALCSKNAEQDVLVVFEQNKNMRLSLGNFVSKRINWMPKSFNIESICTELNILPESVIFIDDSLFETSEVVSTQQKVTCMQTPTNSLEVDLLRWKLEMFLQPRNVTLEDKNRTSYYNDEKIRKQQVDKYNNYQDYLRSLDTCIKLNRCTDISQSSRIVQLSQKTNQFNFMYSRYNEELVYSMLKDDRFSIYTGEVTDNVGDYGMVFLLVTENISKTPKFVRINELVLSCRIFGREIGEHAVLYILNSLQELGYEQLFCTFKETDKNLQFAGFLPSLGFQSNSIIDNNYEYVLNLSKRNLSTSKYPKIEANF